MSKTLIRKYLEADEDGLRVFDEKWVVIHESPCFYYCVPEWKQNTLSFPGAATALARAKARGVKVKRVHKDGSRFAFDSEEKALAHLIFRKKRQVHHLKRETAFVEAFLAAVDQGSLGADARLVPNTGDLVHEYLRFD